VILLEQDALIPNSMKAWSWLLCVNFWKELFLVFKYNPAKRHSVLRRMSRDHKHLLVISVVCWW